MEITPLGGAPGFQSTGADNVRFLISANAGEALGRISKIASGGELSRIMLALKNVFAERDDVPSMVFDEVDAGVSGVAAQRVGEKLGKLSAAKQVICITHLPQISPQRTPPPKPVATRREVSSSSPVSFCSAISTLCAQLQPFV